MQFDNDFEVPVGVDRVWSFLTDVEKVAPCLPGARLIGPVEDSEDDQYEGVVKVKVGPITAEYKGRATIKEMSRDDLKVVIRAEGRDTRGAGNAAADVSASLTAISDDRTKVSVSTDLRISGKVAQFGRGVMGDVSAKLMEKFAQNLGGVLMEEDDSPAEEADSAEGAPGAADSAEGAPDTDAGASDAPASDAGADDAAPAAKPAPVVEAEAVDILEVVKSTRLKWLAPIIRIIGPIGLALQKLFRRRRS